MAIIRRNSNQIFMSALPPPQSGVQPSSSSYVAKAVHFDGASYLSLDSLTAVDGQYSAYSLWFKPSAYSHTNFSSTFYAIDALNTDNNTAYLGQDQDTQTLGTYVGSNTSANMVLDGSGTVVTFDVWHHLIFAARSDTGAMQMLLDGVSIGSVVHNNSPFTIAVNGLTMAVGVDDPSYGGFYLGDIADFWFGMVNLLDGSNNIPAATQQLFRTSGGKPANPSGFPAGGAVLFSGDTSTFATNQGTGGAFTLTGTLTNASTSPSD